MTDSKKLICALTALAFAIRSTAADPLADRPGVTDVKSKSRTHNKSSTLMVSRPTLEKQGEANFTPAFSPPASQCVLERFDVAGAPVTTVYPPFEKGQAAPPSLSGRQRRLGARNPRDLRRTRIADGR